MSSEISDRLAQGSASVLMRIIAAENLNAAFLALKIPSKLI
jgi:hypothetical protein